MFYQFFLYLAPQNFYLFYYFLYLYIHPLFDILLRILSTLISLPNNTKLSFPSPTTHRITLNLTLMLDPCPGSTHSEGKRGHETRTVYGRGMRRRAVQRGHPALP